MDSNMESQRLLNLELLLRWEGYVGNARLRQLFGMSSIRASQWLRELREFQPGWTDWNSTTKTLVATYQFYQNRSADDSTSLSKYLSLIGMSPSVDSSEQHVVSAFSEITTPNPKFFALLSNAAKKGTDVEISYSSMGEPTPHTRVISPHSIVKAGPRWHVRAYSELNNQFRDYTLGRISNVKLIDKAAKFTMLDDKDWMTKVEVRLVAHPALTFEQESVIRLEYFAKTSARISICRAPLINYFIKEVGAAIDVEKQLPPVYLLAVGNVKELSKWLFKK